MADQHGSLPVIGAQYSDLFIGAKGAGQKTKGMQLLDPAVDHVALAARRVLDTPWIDQTDFETPFVQGSRTAESSKLLSIPWPPYRFDIASAIGQGIKVGGKCFEMTDILAVRISAFGNGNKVFSSTDINARRIDIDLLKLAGLF